MLRYGHRILVTDYSCRAMPWAVDDYDYKTSLLTFIV
jgi:hypothetical protein